MTRYAIKLATEALSNLEEEFAFAAYHAPADPEASAERIRLADDIEAQKAVIRELKLTGKGVGTHDDGKARPC